MRVDKVARADIERLLIDVKAGKTAAPTEGERKPGSIATGGSGVAAQCVALMSTLLAFAVARGLRSDNPARGVKKPPVRKMERFLSEDEIARLAVALDAEFNRTGNPIPPPRSNSYCSPAGGAAKSLDSNGNTLISSTNVSDCQIARLAQR